MNLTQIRSGDLVRIANPNRVNYDCQGRVLGILCQEVIVAIENPKIETLSAQLFKDKELQKSA